MGLLKALRKAFGSRSSDLLTTGTPGRAAIRNFTDTGGREGADPRVVLDLDVHVPGKDPYVTQVTSAVPQVYLSKLQPGGSLAVRVDPSDPGALAIDWSRP
jgi:hypothetical protein